MIEVVDLTKFRWMHRPEKKDDWVMSACEQHATALIELGFREGAGDLTGRVNPAKACPLCEGNTTIEKVRRCRWARKAWQTRRARQAQLALPGVHQIVCLCGAAGKDMRDGTAKGPCKDYPNCGFYPIDADVLLARLGR